MTEEAARDHPDWCTARMPKAASPVCQGCMPLALWEATNGITSARSSPRFWDGMISIWSAGGGSFGFSRSVCYCPNCRRSFYDLTGHDASVGAGLG